MQPYSQLIEPLERRTLLAAFAVLKDGVLTITGTGGNDTITAGRSPVDVDNLSKGYIFVATLNNQELDFPDGSVASVVILAGAGNDNIQCGPRGRIEAGAGSDTVFGGSGAVTIFGGAGNDTLAGGSGNDLIFGESGTDQISGAKGNDVLD